MAHSVFSEVRSSKLLKYQKDKTIYTVHSMYWEMEHAYWTTELVYIYS